MTYVNKDLATSRIGIEMQARGWAIFGYKEDRSDSMTDYYSPASWRGVATHPDLPGVVACVNVARYDVESRSGKDEMDVSHIPGDPCGHCAGTGVEPDAVTYDAAIQRPDEAHKIKANREKGIRVVVYGGGSPVHRSDYRDDGQPKCLECYGRGHELKKVEKVLFTWPAFQANPKGKSWHVEMNGTIKASGVGLSYCDSYQAGWERSVSRFVDDVEAAARRAFEAHQRIATAVAAGSTELATTTAARANWTVAVEYEVGSSGAITSVVTTTPRMPKATYYTFLTRFGAYYAKREQKLCVPRRIEASEILDWLVPPAAEEVATVTQAEPQPTQDTPQDTAPAATQAETPAPDAVQVEPIAPVESVPAVAQPQQTFSAIAVKPRRGQKDDQDLVQFSMF